MGKTLNQLLTQISSHELAEWEALCRIEPFGEYRADLRAAMIAVTIANSTRGPKQPAYKITDFLLRFVEPERKYLDEETVKAMFQAHAESFKKDKKKAGKK